MELYSGALVGQLFHHLIALTQFDFVLFEQVVYENLRQKLEKANISFDSLNDLWVHDCVDDLTDISLYITYAATFVMVLLHPPDTHRDA
jgi:hypothetical protein